MEFTTYKGFKIEKRGNAYLLWGKSLFNPIDIVFSSGKTIEGCKKFARSLLKAFHLQTWPVLFTDKITKP